MSSSSSFSLSKSSSDDDNEHRKGPWTLEEDTLLTQYIKNHGQGCWNLLAKRSGLRRTGKSCRLRWLNYLKPDVKRGNLTPQEQLLILELHSQWGNRWSKIAQHLPGRTDNEIKNYWRTRVQKQARQLKIDTDSTEFQKLVRRLWLPRLLQKARESSSSSSAMSLHDQPVPLLLDYVSDQNSAVGTIPPQIPIVSGHGHNMCPSESANTSTQFHALDSSDMSTFVSDGCYTVNNNVCDMESHNLGATLAAAQDMEYHVEDCQVAQSDWMNNDFSCGMWNLDEIWQFSSNS
ncbi:hypothetical protein L6164_008025 [Bauhinia variegata]|uniref:Uncharacterized protein n=1 Tax=Bauhinia variegata TaxID=167791 RepID=A0ACB9PI99_BAUVA|nr:hypothetical protein L6164_008025 [Bauhinia variegata]